MRGVVLSLLCGLLLAAPCFGSDGEVLLPAPGTLPAIEVLRSDHQGVELVFELSELPETIVEVEGQEYHIISIPGGGFAGGRINGGDTHGAVVFDVDLGTRLGVLTLTCGALTNAESTKTNQRDLLACLQSISNSIRKCLECLLCFGLAQSRLLCN